MVGAFKINLEDTTKSLFSRIQRSVAPALSFATFVAAITGTPIALANPGDLARAESSLTARERQARDAGRRSLQENNLLTLHGTSSQDGFTDFYVHSATAFPEEIVLSNGTYNMPIGLGSGDYKQSWRFSKYAAFCEALEKRDQSECAAFVAHNVKHNALRSLRGRRGQVNGQASSVELDPARILILHREIVDEGQGKIASRPTTKNDSALGVWDVLYDVTQNRNDKNGNDASNFLSTKDEYFLLKTDNGVRKFAHIYFRKNDELVAFLQREYVDAFNKTHPKQPVIVQTVPPVPTVPPDIQVPPPAGSSMAPVVPQHNQEPIQESNQELESRSQLPKKEHFLRPLESLSVGLAHTRAYYYDGDDVVSTKDTALEVAGKFQLRKPQWSIFPRGRIVFGFPLSGNIDYQDTKIGNYRRYKVAGDLTLAIPFEKGHIIEGGMYVSQINRDVKFNFGEVQRSEQTLNYGGIVRGNLEGFKEGKFHLDFRMLLRTGLQNESAEGASDIRFTTLDFLLGVPVLYNSVKDCPLENSEHAKEHRCYDLSVTPYFGVRKFLADGGNAAADPSRAVDFTRYALGVDADVRLGGQVLWMVDLRQAWESYPIGNAGPKHHVVDNRVMTGPRFQF